ncbi:des [Symbiodinium necroappetens]|uniref:Des protein n=1 Tax=Symbiodinium necroappetens TaxID=1628268 RepID=A0A813CC60_9DINO|nr:des [Symbiodinium necroappetens]
MALTGQTGRLVADPTIGVEDMTVVFEAWLKSRGTRDFFKEFNMPRGLTFKKAPIGTWLAGVADLCKEIMTLAPNGMLAPKKVRTALGKMNDNDKVNMVIDEGIRIGCAMLRCLKMEAKSKQRCFVLMTGAEQTSVQGVLDIMNCSPSPDDGSQESVSDPTRALSEPPREMLALTDAPGDAKPLEDDTLSLSPRPSFRRSKQLDPMAVFDRVLSRVSSEEAEPEDLPEASSSSHAGPHASTATPMDMQFAYLLSQAECVEPLDNKAQLIIFRKNSTQKKGKGKGQQKDQAKKTTDNVKIPKSKASKVKADESLKSEAPEISEEKDKIPVTRCFKKSPAIPKTDESPKSEQSTPKAKASPKSTKASPKSTPKSKAAPKASAEKNKKKTESANSKRTKTEPEVKKPAEDEHDGAGKKKMKMDRTAIRKRLVSKAYHNERDQKMKAGVDKERAAEMGRAAAKRAGDQFDEENPKEKKAKLNPEEEERDHESECADAANPEGPDQEAD